MNSIDRARAVPPGSSGPDPHPRGPVRSGASVPRSTYGATTARRSPGSTMTMPADRLSLPRVAKVVAALEILLGVGALGGGLVLIVAPRGEIMPLPISALAGSPFETYLGPGVILCTVLGIGPLLAARLVWIRHPLAPLAAVVVGIALLIWVAVEIAIIG